MIDRVRMRYRATHRDGGTEASTDLRDLAALLDELGPAEDELGEVAVDGDDGWCVAVDGAGFATLMHPAHGGPVHRGPLARDALIGSMRAVAELRGRQLRAEHAWRPGYGRPLPARPIGTFAIRAGAPASMIARRTPDDSLCEAIENCFDMDAEPMMVEWNGVEFPVGYKYDLDSMAADIALMLDAVTGAAAGRWQNGWPSSTFAADWTVRWEGDWLAVRAHWRAVAKIEVGALNARPEVVMKRAAFVAAWQRPLSVVVAALQRSGYDERVLPEMAALVAAIAR